MKKKRMLQTEFGKFTQSIKDLTDEPALLGLIQIGLVMLSAALPVVSILSILLDVYTIGMKQQGIKIGLCSIILTCFSMALPQVAILSIILIVYSMIMGMMKDN